MERRPTSDISIPDADGHAGLAPEAVQGGRGLFLKNTFASMAYRDFVYLWLGQITHAFALWIDQIAKPLLILAIGGTAVDLGLVLVVRTVPAITFGLPAGVLADNFNRRMILLLTKVAVLVLGVGFAALLVFGRLELWHIYAYNALRGAAMAFDQPARRAIIPSIVPGHLVTNAMALSTGSMTATRIAGAAGAGLIIAVAGFEGAYVTAAVVYVGAVLFTWLLNPPDHERSGYQGVRSMGSDFLEGLRFAWNTPAVRGVLIISLGYFTFGMAFMQVFTPLLAKQVLGIGDAGFGFLISVAAVGSTVGALVLAAANPTRRRGVMMLSILLLFGLLLALFAGVTYAPPEAMVLGTIALPVLLAFIVVVFVGMAQAFFFPLINAVLMDAAPEHMRGRVISVLTLDRAMTTFGGALAGFLSFYMGVQVAQILFGLACAVTAVVMFAAYPPLRRID